MSVTIENYEARKASIITLLRQIITDFESDACQAESLSLEIIYHGLPSRDVINSAPNGERIFTIRYMHIPTMQTFNMRYYELQQEYNGEYVVPKLTGER